MEHKDRELLIARIVSGTLPVKIENQRLWINNPTRKQRLLAQEVYRDAYEEAAAEDCHTETTLLNWMMKEKLWTSEETKLLEGIEKDIENLKVGLYKVRAVKSKSRIARNTLAKAQAKYDELFAKRHTFDQQTCNSLAFQAKLRFLISKTIVDDNGNNVAGEDLVYESLSQYLASRLSEGQYRELARTEPWRSIWSARSAASSVFDTPACDLTEEQRHLTGFSMFYDNVWSHPERPADEVINDDCVLDGWLILQRRDLEKDRKSKPEDFVQNEKILDSQEVFIVVDNDEDRESVEELNDPIAARLKRQRMNFLAQKGVVQEFDMPDQALEIKMAKNRASNGPPKTN